jgi:hypothetical protein
VQTSPLRSWAKTQLHLRNAAAQTRIVSKARIRLDSRKSVRSFKGIICVDISEFESCLPSHAVRSLRALLAFQEYVHYSRQLVGVRESVRSHPGPAESPGIRGVAHVVIANAISPNSTTINVKAGPRAIFCLLLEASKKQRAQGSKRLS